MDSQQSQKEDQIKGEQSKTGSFKVKLAIFFGYNGQKFQGMQYQREHSNTIENTLHALLLENGFILKSNAHELRRIKWSRAARTDKKVHALCNGISMKLEISQKFVTEKGTRDLHYGKIISELNDQLPMDIRVLVLRRVGKSFDMRHDAKTRIYNYIIPSRLFQGFAKFKADNPIEGENLDNVIKVLNNLVKFYLGTHNYWNFTRGYKKTDPRCQRFMIKMIAEKVEESTVKTILQQCGKDPQKQYESFIRFTLVGQSFIYHQIRKMIGLLIKIFSEQLEGEQTIRKAFKSEQFDVYLAPGEGLYLNRMTFESYNNRRDTKEKIQFTEEEEERIRQYRAYLETKIIKHEIEEQVFSGWLEHRQDYDKKEEEEEEELSNNEESNEGNKGDRKGGRKGDRRGGQRGSKGNKKEQKEKKQHEDKEQEKQKVEQAEKDPGVKNDQ